MWSILIQALRYLLPKHRSRLKFIEDGIRFSFPVCTHGDTRQIDVLDKLTASSESLLLSSSIVSSLYLPPPSPFDLWGRASEIRLRLISPGGKKTCILCSEYELTKEHPIRVEQPTPLVIYERKKREKKRRRWIWSWEWQIRFRIFSFAATSGK